MPPISASQRFPERFHLFNIKTTSVGHSIKYLLFALGNIYKNCPFHYITAFWFQYRPRPIVFLNVFCYIHAVKIYLVLVEIETITTTLQKSYVPSIYIYTCEVLNQISVIHAVTQQSDYTWPLVTII